MCEKDKKVDVKQTLIAFIPLLWWTAIGMGFFILGFKQVEKFESETNHLLGIVIMAIATTKILCWGHHPRIYYTQTEVTPCK